MTTELDRTALERDVRSHTRRSVARTLVAIVFGIGVILSAAFVVVLNLAEAVTKAQVEAMQKREQTVLARSQAAEAKAESEKREAVNDFFQWLTSSREVAARAFRLGIQVGLLSETAQSELANRAKVDMDDQDYTALTMEALGPKSPLLEFLVRKEKSGTPGFVVSLGRTGTITSQLEVGDNPVVDLAIPPDYESRFAWASMIDLSGNVFNISDGSVPVAESAAWTQSAEVAGVINGGFVRLTWSIRDVQDFPNGRLAFQVVDSGPSGPVLVTALFSSQPFARRPSIESLASFLGGLEELENTGVEIEAVYQILSISY